MLAVKDTKVQTKELTAAPQTHDHALRPAGKTEDSLAILQRNLGNGYLQSVVEPYTSFAADGHKHITATLWSNGQAFSQGNRAAFGAQPDRNLSQVRITPIPSAVNAWVQRQMQPGPRRLLLEPANSSRFDPLTSFKQSPALPGGPNPEELTNFAFTRGPVHFVFKIPKSIEMYLPVALQGKRQINFALKAETSGDFSFSVTLDDRSDIQISLKGGVSLGEDENRAGGEIVISSKRKVCRRDTADQIKTEIKAAGEKLTKAVNKLQGTERKMPPPPWPETSIITPSAGEESEILDGKRWIDVTKSIGDLYDASKKFTDSCTEAPVFSIGVGVSTPIGEQKQPTPEELAKPGPFFGTYAGINLRFPF